MLYIRIYRCISAYM